MFRESLEFTRAHSLLFDVAPDQTGSIFAQLPEPIRERWEANGVRTVFGFVPTGSDPRLQAARRAGFAVQPVDINRIRRNDFGILKGLVVRLRAELRENPAAFYFPAEDTADVMSCAAAFLVSLQATPELAAPEGAIQFIFGRDELHEEDFRVFRFKEALESGYQMPEAVRRHFGLIGGSNGKAPTPPATPGASAAVASVAAAAASAATVSEKDGSARVEPSPNAPDNTTDTDTAERKAEAPDAKQIAPEPTQTKPGRTTTAVEATTSKAAEQKPKLPPAASLDSTPGSFKPSKFFTIRNKLLMIISILIFSALGVMIFLASFFYRQDSESRINEYALKTTELIGQKIEGEFTSLTYTALSSGTSLLSTRSPAERDLFTELFFRNNPSFATVAVLKNENGKLTEVRAIYNERFLKESQVDAQKLQAVVAQNERLLQATLAGSQVVRNVSPGLPVPLLALGASFGEGGERYVVAGLINPARFLESFKATGIIVTYMVDNQGIVVAHADSKLVLAAENMSRRELVKRMLVANTDNGQLSYQAANGAAELGFFKKLGFAGLAVVSSVSEADAFRAVEAMQNRNLMILVIVLFTAVLIVFFFARTLSVPIGRLVQATRQVEEGDYAFAIKPSTRDEIGRLTHSFTSMTGGLAERERLKDSMTRFVNKEVAEKAARGELALGGQEKDCAIFFSDLRGFTAMSEKMTPEEVVEYLNEYFTDMVGCVSETHGVVDKYIGDAIMATWGAVQSIGDNTENAVNAALMMRARLIEFNRRGQGKRPFAKFGCGINSGPVVSGQIGSSQKMEYTVIGDAVNLASRVETLNKPFGTDILISAESYQRVKDIFEVEQMPAISVKGKSEPQTIYAVLGRKDDPDCPRSMDEVRARTGGDPPKVDLAAFHEAKEEKFEVLQG